MFTWLIIFFLLAVGVSFLCSLWEAVLLSITPSYAQIKLQEGTRMGLELEAFKANIDRPLAAILTLNTIAHTVGAIGVGQQATIIWSDSHLLITTLLVPLLMTLSILILSEIIPKTIGAMYWKEFAAFTVRSLSLVIALLAPLVWMCQFITRSFKKDPSTSVFSRSDFLAMAEIGVREGVIEQLESDLIRSMLRFKSVLVSAIMTPRSVVKMAAENTSIREFFEANKALPFSRIPLYTAGDRDQVTGYILKDELLAGIVEERGDQPIQTLCRDIMSVDAATPIPDVFARFIERREHIALVRDEAGHLLGVVSMEDVIETLLGMEIVDEMDTVEDMQQLARKNWQKRARRLGLWVDASDQKQDD